MSIDKKILPEVSIIIPILNCADKLSAYFENAFTLSVFQHDNTSQEKIAWWVNQQISKTYNNRTGMFDKNTTDPATLTARIYELTRLPQKILANIQINHHNE